MAIVGFSNPYVGLYSYDESAGIKYTGVKKLARGVDVSVSATSSDGGKLYADNMLAEEEAGFFTEGTFSLTVDGLATVAKNLIMGTEEATDWTEYNDDQNTPNVGFGYIIKEVNSGVTGYRPVLFYKCKFDLVNDNAATQGETIDFQTTALSGKIMRSEAPKHPWKADGKLYTDEADAVSALLAKMA